MSSEKRRPFCLGLNVLNPIHLNEAISDGEQQLIPWEHYKNYFHYSGNCNCHHDRLFHSPLA